MGQGAEDAEAAAEASEALCDLRESLRGPTKESYHDFEWTDRRGNKTKLKNLSNLRLKTIQNYLKKRGGEGSKGWLEVINYVLSNR